MANSFVNIKNKKAFHEYKLFDRYEAGVALLGSEVKAIREGKLSFSEGWVEVTRDLEIFLQQVYIGPYGHSNVLNHEEKRPRKLLLKKKEIIKINNTVCSKGMTVVPLRFYSKRSLIKVEISLAQGKKLYDKRQSSRKKEDERAMAKALKHKVRNFSS